MNFGKQFLVYGLTGALSRLAGLLLVPIYTRTLSMEDYGRVEILLAVHMLLTLTVGLQSESAVARDYHRAEAENWLLDLMRGAVWTTLGGAILVGVAVAGLVLAFGFAPYLREYLLWLTLISVLTQLMGIQLVAIRFGGKPVFYAMLTLGDILLTTGASVVLVVFFDYGMAGVVAALGIGKALPVMLAWASTFGTAAWHRSSFARVRGIVAYSLPTVPAVLLNWLQNIGTRVAWALFLSVTAVAVAGIAMRVASLFALVVYSFRLAWEPSAFRNLDEHKEGSAAFAVTLDWAVVLLFFAASVTILFAPVLVALFAPPAYLGATKLVAAFVLGQVWVGVAVVTTMGIHGARRTSRLNHVQLAGTTVHLAILALLAPMIGTSGAAAAYLASTMMTAIVATYYSNLLFSAGFSWRLLSVSVIATVAVSLMAYWRPVYRASLFPDPMLVAVLVVTIISVPMFGLSGRRRSEMMSKLAEASRNVQQALQRKP